MRCPVCKCLITESTGICSYCHHPITSGFISGYDDNEALIGDDIVLSLEFTLDRQDLRGWGISNSIHIGYETTYHESDRTVVHRTWGSDNEKVETLLLPGNIQFQHQLFAYIRQERPSWLADKQNRSTSDAFAELLKKYFGK